MCRKNQLWACCAFALGLGFLIGLCISSTLLQICLGAACIAAGVLLLRRK